MRSMFRVLALGLALLALPAQALLLLSELPGPQLDVDHRAGRIVPSSAALAQASALGAEAQWTAYGTVKTLVRHGGYLAQGYEGTPAEAARAFIRDNRALFRLSEASVAALTVVSEGITPGNKGRAILFRQDFMGLPVTLDAQITVGIAEGRVYYVSSSAVGEQPPVGPASLTPSEAWLVAANDVRLNLLPGHINSVLDRSRTRGWHLLSVDGLAEVQRARLVAVPMPEGGVRQAYETIVLKMQGGEVLAFVHFVDAQNGRVLRRENRVDWQSAPTTEVYTGSFATSATCGPRHPFDVPAGQVQIAVTAASGNPANDVFINLYFNDTLVASNDLLTSPETLTYSPSGGIAEGEYEVEVCPFDGSSLPPGNYGGTFSYSSSSGPAAINLPSWKWNPAYPDVDYGNADIRKTGCWTSDAAPVCDFIVGNLASRFPWDVAVPGGVPTNTTVGNNALTAESWGSPLTPSTPYRPVSPTRDYDFPFENKWAASKCDPSNLVPGGNDIDAAIVNLFVTHNRMHDWSYHLGFTEANSNLQTNNFGNTATTRENDPEIGNVQAGAISGSPNSPSFYTAPGRDNANQITLQDGTPGITNQYLFQSLGASLYVPCADADYDMSVIGHEYTHAITNRMIGGPDASIGGHQGDAMGESWGDLGAAEHMIEYNYLPVGDEAPTSVGPFATGNKAVGIRNYALDASPLNYSNVGYDTPGPAVHSDGEIWNATQWDVRQLLVDKWDSAYPYSDLQRQRECADGLYQADACPGNRRWIQLMYDSFLLMPATPSMLDARDATLAADLARFDGANQRELWLGFARRGMGVDAFSADADDTDPVASFVSPMEPFSTVRFVVQAGDETNAVIGKARIYIGEYAVGSSPVADTDAETVVDATSPLTQRATANLGDSTRLMAGNYDFIIEAPGYGIHRFRNTVIGGDATLTFTLPTNWASASKGATVATTATVAANQAARGTLIDDDENTGVRFDDSEPVAGGNAIVTLGGGARMISTLHVSTAASPSNPGRYTGLRKFELLTCNGSCAAPADFTLAYTSPDDAFPSTNIRPTQRTLNLRSFSFTPVLASHVMVRAVNNQCTGQPLFAGDKDNDPTVNADCPSFDPPPQAGVDVLGGEIVPLTKPASVVRASEIQVFGSAPKLAGASVAPPPSGSSSSSSGGSSSSSSSGGSSSGAATSSSSSGSTITPAAPGSTGSSSTSDQAGRFGGGALGLLLLVPGLALGLRRHRRLAA